jgi:hypothetical protein
MRTQKTCSACDNCAQNRFSYSEVFNKLPLSLKKCSGWNYSAHTLLTIRHASQAAAPGFVLKFSAKLRKQAKESPSYGPRRFANLL